MDSNTLVSLLVTCLPLQKACHASLYTQHPSELVTKMTVSESVYPRICHATYAHEECCSQVNWVGNVGDSGHAHEMDHKYWNPRDNVNSNQQENRFGHFNLKIRSMQERRILNKFSNNPLCINFLPSFLPSFMYFVSFFCGGRGGGSVFLKRQIHNSVSFKGLCAPLRVKRV